MSARTIDTARGHASSLRIGAMAGTFSGGSVAIAMIVWDCIFQAQEHVRELADKPGAYDLPEGLRGWANEVFNRLRAPAGLPESARVMALGIAAGAVVGLLTGWTLSHRAKRKALRA